MKETQPPGKVLGFRSREVLVDAVNTARAQETALKSIRDRLAAIDRLLTEVSILAAKEQKRLDKLGR